MLTENKNIDQLPRDKFNVQDLFSVKDLYNSRVHYGHRLGSLDDHMKPFLYGHRLGHTIFDLDITAKYLYTALNFVAHVAHKNGVILLFSRDSKNLHLVEKTAKDCGEFAHTRFWRGGVFTNADTQFGSVTRLPDLCIFFSTLNTILAQHVAIRDCAKMGIPSIGIVDSNSNPNLVTYPVPGNDDSTAAVKLYCKLFKNAIIKGKEKRTSEQNEKYETETEV